MALKFKKKLVLNKSTIVNLEESEMKVMGGASVTSECNVCYTHYTICNVCTIYCTYDTLCAICTYYCHK